MIPSTPSNRSHGPLDQVAAQAPEQPLSHSVDSGSEDGLGYMEGTLLVSFLQRSFQELEGRRECI